MKSSLSDSPFKSMSSALFLQTPENRNYSTLPSPHPPSLRLHFLLIIISCVLAGVLPLYRVRVSPIFRCQLDLGSDSVFCYLLVQNYLLNPQPPSPASHNPPPPPLPPCPASFPSFSTPPVFFGSRFLLSHPPCTKPSILLIFPFVLQSSSLCCFYSQEGTTPSPVFFSPLLLWPLAQIPLYPPEFRSP